MDGRRISFPNQMPKGEKWLPDFPTAFSKSYRHFIFVHFRFNNLIFITLSHFEVILLFSQDQIHGGIQSGSVIMLEYYDKIIK